MNTNKFFQQAIKMAQDSIYDGAKYLGKWHGFFVYEPTFDNDEPRSIGFPQFIIACGDGCRWTASNEESQAIMRHLWKYK